MSLTRKSVLILLCFLWAIPACNMPQPVVATLPVENPATSPGASQAPTVTQAPPTIQPAASSPSTSAPASPSVTQSYGIFIPSIPRGQINATPQPALTATQAPAASLVEIEASADTVRVGETLTVTGRPVGVGLPYYALVIRDNGVQDAPPVVQITYANKIDSQFDSSQVLELVSAQASQEQATFVLLARQPGLTTISVNATGEVQPPDSGGKAWSGASGSVVITVTE